ALTSSLNGDHLHPSSGQILIFPLHRIPPPTCTPRTPMQAPAPPALFGPRETFATALPQTWTLTWTQALMSPCRLITSSRKLASPLKPPLKDKTSKRLRSTPPPRAM